MPYKLQKYEKEFSKRILQVWPNVYEYSAFLLDAEKLAKEDNVRNIESYIEALTMRYVMASTDYGLFYRIRNEESTIINRHVHTLIHYSVKSAYGYSIWKILQIRKTGII